MVLTEASNGKTKEGPVFGRTLSICPDADLNLNLK